jgi:UDP-galactopyranose mutase
MQSQDVLCFSHLRWNFVYQRPNHLMIRCARDRRVLFIEEPMPDASDAWLERTAIAEQLQRVVPHVPAQLSESDENELVARMLAALCSELGIERPVHWLYTPMMLPISEALSRSVVVYDCMDELSSFRFAPPELKQREEKLMALADVMFTGGMALYECKRARHPNVHAMPSSVDAAFFARAREITDVPPDEAAIPRPRIGYAGVIDERMDLELIQRMARENPSWQLILIGPVVKIEEQALPRAANIHYLGPKRYDDLPHYLAGWDVAMLPFALNEATRFISPTKTPEYLAAGRSVVSTAIQDVVDPYEGLGLVRIGRDHAGFIAHVQALLSSNEPYLPPLRDTFLAQNSWDATWKKMDRLVREAALRHASHRLEARAVNEGQYV